MPRRSVTALAMTLNFLTAAPSGAPLRQPRVNVRFHHVHYAAPDPAAAMTEAANALNARRVILQGLGVGVAVDDHYLLFEKAQGPGPPASSSPSTAVDRATRWLEDVGIGIAGEPGKARWLEASNARWIRHVAFAADDLPAAATHLRVQGVEPRQQSEDSLLYQSRDGELVELVRDTDRPDAFWCPMHPEVRASFAANCPYCAMTLVAMPPPKLGEYRMDVTPVHRRGGKGVERLRFTVRDPETGASVDRFTEVHERLFHLFIVSRDLNDFVHEHPELSGGRFELAIDLPPGAYMLIADFLPVGGTPQMVQQAIVVGERKAPFAVPDLKPDPSEKVVEGIRVRLASDLVAGRAGTLRFSFSEAATGDPIVNLQPFLGAPGHLLIVNRDLTDAFHVHPASAASRGPDVTFSPLLPSAGFYKLWVQVQRGGKVITVPFVIDVK